jgi:hypothetical protein
MPILNFECLKCKTKLQKKPQDRKFEIYFSSDQPTVKRGWTPCPYCGKKMEIE